MMRVCACMRVRMLALALWLVFGFVFLVLYRTAGPSSLHHAFLVSRHVQSYPILLRPQVCLQTRPLSRLLVAVKSHAGHADRRAALRDTWARPGQQAGELGGVLCVVFLLGRGQEGEVEQAAVVEESRHHGDILQWDFQESFFNVTLKELLFWRWLCNQHRPGGNGPQLQVAPYVLRTDDDVFVDVGGIFALLRPVRDLGPPSPLYVGRAFIGTSPVRLWWNKYYIPPSLYPDATYPPYLGGGGYLVSRETVQLFLRASAKVPLFPIDDVYVGMCAQVANVSVQHHPSFMPREFSPSLSPCSYAGALVLHKLEPLQLRQLWSFYSGQGDTCSPAVRV